MSKRKELFPTSKTNKDDKLVVRLDPVLKQKFVEFVEKKGATVSDYVRQMIVKEINEETPNLKESVKDIVMKVTNPEIGFYKEMESMKNEINTIREHIEKYIIKEKDSK